MASFGEKDFTPGGVKVIGAWENDRNAASRELIHNVFRHLYGDNVQTIIAHHLCYQIQDGDYFVVEEVPSMDSLIFDHDIGRRLWGDDYKTALWHLAAYPAEQRDAQFAELFYAKFPHFK